MVPPCSSRISRVRLYSRPHQQRLYRTVTFFGPAFQPVHAAIWLIRFRSALLTESRLLSFPLATKMFQFARFASPPYTFRRRWPYGRVAPFGNPRIRARLPAPLGLSQVPTSFIASRRQDIRHLPLMTWSCLPMAVRATWNPDLPARFSACMPTRCRGAAVGRLGTIVSPDPLGGSDDSGLLSSRFNSRFRATCENARVAKRNAFYSRDLSRNRRPAGPGPLDAG